jgi:hypothetical protein
MKHFSWLVALALCLLQGCGEAVTENADAEQAGPALRTALEAWKSGKSEGELRNQKPPIIMNEDDWRSGKRLVDFKMDPAGALFGRQVRWRVQIKLQEPSGKTVDRQATYIIDTAPRLVIVRDSFAS